MNSKNANKLKIIELENIKYSERVIRSLFPHVTVLFLYVLLGIGFFYLFIFDPTDISFWVGLSLYFPLFSYLIVIKPFIESKIYITRIEFDENQNEIKIDYLKFNHKRQVAIGVKEIKYNVLNSYKISLADRIVFLDGERELFKQYCNTNWTLNKIIDVAQALEKLGVKKPYGYNK